jgi:hypothetical protein
VSLQYRADLALTCFVAALLGATEAGPGSARSPLIPTNDTQLLLLLRVMTPVMKAYTAKHAIHGIQECMESLGGVGYMENVENPEMNVARIFRDANVLAIWEGTTDVLASDTVKVVTGREGAKVLSALDAWVSATLARGSGFAGEKAAIRQAWTAARVIPADKEEALSEGRAILHAFGDIVCATLLVADAERDGDNVAAEVATRFIAKAFGVKPVAAKWTDRTKMDMAIAFAREAGQHAKL